eukprot:7003368-Alexandrium_andersonii.AAC.1
MISEGTSEALAEEVESMIARRKAQLLRTQPVAVTIRALMDKQARLQKQLGTAEQAAREACARRDDIAARLSQVSAELVEAEQVAMRGSPQRGSGSDVADVAMGGDGCSSLQQPVASAG